jgi:flagellar basal body-associated protein FliL
MRKLPLSFSLLCFLALGAWQGIFVSRAFAQEPAAKTNETVKSKKGDKKGNDDDDISGGRFEGDPIYVHIKPMVLPVINEEGVEQLVSLVLDVHVKDSETADTLHKDMPRVMDALLRNLYGGLEDGSLKKGKLVNIQKIKSNAINAIGEIVGRDKIVDVLVQGVTQRVL